MPVETCNRLPESPQVKVFMTGLFILQFDPKSTHCYVNIHKPAPSHLFSFVVKAKQVGYPDWTLFRHYGDLDEEIRIQVTGATMSAVCKHQYGEVFNREKPTSEQEKDLRWMLDFSYLHPMKKLTLDLRRLGPGIHINSGVFYTARRTDPKRVQVLKTRQMQTGAEELDLHSIPCLIGVNINLNANEYVYIIRGDERVIRLPNRSSEGITYEIYIENDPESPYHRHEVAPARRSNQRGADRRISHFRKYYQVIRGVSGAEEFEIEYEPLVMLKDDEKTSTPDVPCMPTECSNCG
jgi:hypothetical protein